MTARAFFKEVVSVQKLLAVDDFDLIEVVEAGIAEGKLDKLAITELLDRRISARKRDGEGFDEAFVRIAVGYGVARPAEDDVSQKLFLIAKGLPGRDYKAETTFKKMSTAPERASDRPTSADPAQIQAAAVRQWEHLVSTAHRMSPHLTRSQVVDEILRVAEGQEAFKAAKGTPAQLAAAHGMVIPAGERTASDVASDRFRSRP